MYSLIYLSLCFACLCHTFIQFLLMLAVFICVSWQMSIHLFFFILFYFQNQDFRLQEAHFDIFPFNRSTFFLSFFYNCTFSQDCYSSHSAKWKIMYMCVCVLFICYNNCYNCITKYTICTINTRKKQLLHSCKTFVY